MLNERKLLCARSIVHRIARSRSYPLSTVPVGVVVCVPCVIIKSGLLLVSQLLPNTKRNEVRSVLFCSAVGVLLLKGVASK